jgi:hypothetical protein
MSHWPFVIAAYVVTLGGTFGLLTWAWTSMRSAEKKAERLSRRS